MADDMMYPSFWGWLRGEKPRPSTAGQPLPNPEATMSLGEHFRFDPLGAMTDVLLGASPIPLPWVPETQSSRFGQVLGAAVPFFSGLKSLKSVPSMTKNLATRVAAEARTPVVSELGPVNPAFSQPIKMPPVIKVAEPPIGPPAAPHGFGLGEMPPMIGDLPDLSRIPVSKTRPVPKTPIQILADKTGY